MTNAHPLSILVALVDGGGTVPPEMAAVRRLVQRGHRVTVLAEDSMTDDVQQTGAILRRWQHAPNRPDRHPDNDPYRDWECSNPLQLFSRLIDKQFVGPAPMYAADVMTAIQADRPDVVLCSQFAFGAMIAAEAVGVPFQVLMPNVYMVPAPGCTPAGMGLRPARTMAGRARDRVVNGVLQRVTDRGVKRLNEVRAQFGLASVEHFFDQVHRADRQLLMTSAAFDFPAALPATVQYVGPVLDDPVWVQPWQPPQGEGPLVLVAMSSTFQDHAACLQRIIDALGSLPVRAVVTTGPTIEPGSLQASANVSVVRAAPHSEVMRHAAVVVTHGGHGTVMKSLAAGVPLIVMPHGRDQADNAARVVARGAGISLRRTAKPARIARAVARVISDESMAAAAARLGESVVSDAATDRLVETIESAAPVRSRHEPDKAHSPCYGRPS